MTQAPFAELRTSRSTQVDRELLERAQPARCAGQRGGRASSVVEGSPVFRPEREAQVIHGLQHRQRQDR
jgi:hypothetical protein